MTNRRAQQLIEYQDAGWSWSGFIDGSWRIETPQGKVAFVSRDYVPDVLDAIQYVLDMRLA
jgi:hypothetical protein